MSNVRRIVLTAVVLALSVATLADRLAAQVGPSPYRTVDGWAKLPGDREMGAVGDVAIDPELLPDAPHAGSPIHRRFQGKSDQGLNLFRCHPVGFRNDRYRWSGQVREDIHRHADGDNRPAE